MRWIDLWRGSIYWSCQADTAPVPANNESNGVVAPPERGRRRTTFFRRKEENMTTRLWLVIAVGVALLAPAFGGDAAKEDAKKLQGTWVIKMASHKGNPAEKGV